MYSSTFIRALLLAFSISQIIYWYFLATAANNQLEMMWKEAVVAKFGVMDLSMNLRRDGEDRF